MYCKIFFQNKALIVSKDRDKILYLNSKQNLEESSDNFGIIEISSGKVYFTPLVFCLIRAKKPYKENGKLSYNKLFMEKKKLKEEIQIGGINLKITRLENYNLQFYLYQRRNQNGEVIRNDISFTNSNIKQFQNPVLLGSETGLFPGQIPEAEGNISKKHCYLGYDFDKNLFYVVDYGTIGEGSSNGTFVVLTKNTLEISDECAFIVYNYENVQFPFTIFPSLD